MITQTTITPDASAALQRLRSYYLARAAFSFAWVAAAFTLGRSVPPVAVILLVAYPVWDAVANLADAQWSGGLKANPSQALNAAVSAATTIAVLVAIGQSPHAVLAVFGVWAILAGLGQLATGLRRLRAGAQWAMVLSGAQSALAGSFFIARAAGPATPGVADIAPYAAFGAFYFLVSAVWLIVTQARRGGTREGVVG